MRCWKRAVRVCVALFVTVFVGSAGWASAPSAAQSAELENWVKRNAVALRRVGPGGSDSDLRPLGKLVRPDTRVISFQERTHGVHEYLTMRNRLFAYLVEHHGVTAYAAETECSSGALVDDYVTQGGTLTSDVVKAAYPSDAVDWIENRQLIEWMRAYNLRSTTVRPVRYYGVDPTARWDASDPQMGKLHELALAYVRRFDPVRAKALEERLLPLPIFFTHPVYYPDRELLPLEAAELDQRTAAVADLINLFEVQEAHWVSRTSPLEYYRAYQAAVCARQLNQSLRWGDILLRDVSMAENVRLALEREGRQGRLFFFSAGYHAQKGPMAGQRAGKEAGAAAYLSARLGDQLTVIGTVGTAPAGSTGSDATPRGNFRVSPSPSFDALLGTVLHPVFFLNLTGMPPMRTVQEETSVHARWSMVTYPQWRAQDHFDAVIAFKCVQRLPRQDRDDERSGCPSISN